MGSLRPHALVLALIVALITGACGGGGGDEDSAGATTTTRRQADGELLVHPASYDLVTGVDQRFIAGATFDDGTALAYGTVEFEFLYLGTRSSPLDEPRPGPTATATFLPIPGSEPQPGAGEAPQRQEPSDIRGVYGAEGVRFDTAGFWRVVLRADVEGERLTADAAFGVNDEHRTPAPGDRAPDVDQPTAGTEGVEPTAIDSRARDGDMPDAQLHATTVSDALTAGKPVMVVVATPVYCVSRFCGPITDAVAELASTYEDTAAFVHIEVWEDFEDKRVNAAARAWMSKDPESQSLTEPWVFLVGADGVITHRWDNVATVVEMTAALENLRQ
jgi:hypothetical protein